MTSTLIGALDIGGTKIAAIVANEHGPLVRLSAPTAKTGSERALAEQGVALLQQACDQAGVSHDSLRQVGVASAGPFVDQGGMLAVSTPNICGGLSAQSDLPNDWIAIPLEAVLREQYDNVVIKNDCVGALIGERTFGAALDVPNCVYVTWSTGIGFGLCVDGNILNGKAGNAGHAGHQLMDAASKAPCGCGNLGDLESLISGRNLGTRLGQSTADAFGAARKGEPQAKAIATEAAQWFGRGLYNVAATLDTSLFVIGGSVWEHHADWLAPIVLHEITSRLPPVTRGVQISAAVLGKFVTDIGALAMVMPPEWIPRWRQEQPWRLLAD
ncbi:MAG: ROK family protein [Janthinobacterium lividum]